MRRSFPRAGHDNENHLILQDVFRTFDLSSKCQAYARSIFSKGNLQIEGGCIIIRLATSNKHTVMIFLRYISSSDKLLCSTVVLCEFETTYRSSK